MEAYVRTVMALLQGETIEAEIEGKRRLIRLEWRRGWLCAPRSRR